MQVAQGINILFFGPSGRCGDFSKCLCNFAVINSIAASHMGDDGAAGVLYMPQREGLSISRQTVKGQREKMGERA